MDIFTRLIKIDQVCVIGSGEVLRVPSARSAALLPPAIPLLVVPAIVREVLLPGLCVRRIRIHRHSLLLHLHLSSWLVLQDQQEKARTPSPWMIWMSRL